jgi:serine protease
VIASTSGDFDWMEVRPKSVGPDGLGSYRVSADRTGLPDGTYEGSVRVRTDTLDDLVIPVLLRVAPPQLALDTVGRIYVLLLDANGETVAEQGLDLKGGVYAYRFDNVPAGEYRIAAGTDMNDDGFICDDGEACGAYPTLSLLERIWLERDQTALDFSVGFRARATDAVLGSGAGVPRHSGAGFLRP